MCGHAAKPPPKTFTRSAWKRVAHDDFKTSRGNEIESRCPKRRRQPSELSTTSAPGPFFFMDSMAFFALALLE